MGGATLRVARVRVPRPCRPCRCARFARRGVPAIEHRGPLARLTEPWHRLIRAVVYASRAFMCHDRVGRAGDVHRQETIESRVNRTAWGPCPIGRRGTLARLTEPWHRLIRAVVYASRAFMCHGRVGRAGDVHRQETIESRVNRTAWGPCPIGRRGTLARLAEPWHTRDAERLATRYTRRAVGPTDTTVKGHGSQSRGTRATRNVAPPAIPAEPSAPPTPP